MRFSALAFGRAWIVLVMAAGGAAPRSLAAQRQPPPPADSAAAAATAAAALRPPIGPRRAFLYSFLLPGYSQAVLGRHKAGAAFLFVEAISLAMIRESSADLSEARRTANDSVVVQYVDGQGNVNVVIAPPRFDDDFVHTRSAHVEDWIAVLVANHLFAGADAFVAAHLWDVHAQIGLRLLPRARVAALSAAFTW